MVTFRKTVWVVLLIAVVGLPGAVTEVSYSQSAACPQIVAQALDATEQVCGATGRNEACYGYMLVDAQAQPDVDDFSFSAMGDLEAVAAIRSMRLSGMDEEAGLWGIALMRLRASLPEEARAHNVTLLLFGNVAIENAVPAAQAVEITPRTNLNVRSRPSTEGSVVANLAAGTSAVIDGRSGDGEWLHVLPGDSLQEGWVYAPAVMSADEIDALPIVDYTVPRYEPMQAFYFQSAADDAACPEAPDSGLMIQTPEGMGRVTFLINEVDIQLGSTVYFQAQPGGEMAVIVVEGEARARAYGVTSRAIAGSYLTIPLSDDLTPAGPPGLPRAYAMASVNALPIQSLEREITIHEPLTEAELANLLQAIEEETSAEALNAGLGGPEVGAGASGRDPIPGGGTANNPIFGENTPGHGGTPPGQEKKD